MKKISIFLFAFIGMIQLGMAQLDRSQMPTAGPAPEIRFGEAEHFTLPNGLKVYVIQNSKLPRVTFSLILDRDPVLEGDKAGMLDMVGEMMTAGTANRSKDELNEAIDFIGARLNASSTSISASALVRHIDKITELMADVLYNPVFPQEELDKLKTQAISGLALQRNDNSAISGVLGAKLVFGTDHPYGESESEETIGNITVEDIKAYYETYFKPNIAYLAIVGDIDKASAEKLVKKHFSAWKKGDVPNHTYPTRDVPQSNMVALVDRPTANQSVISVTYPVQVSMASEDYLSSRVLNFILGGGGSSRLFMNLREDKGFTYGAYSNIGADKLISRFSAGASVGTHTTDSAIVEIIYEMEKIRTEGITEKELAAAKANLSGSFARSLENPGTVASFAINTERYKLPKDYYTTYLQRIANLSVEDINNAAKKFIKPTNMYITVVGKGDAIKENLERFGPVFLFTTSGDPAKAAQDAGDISASEVIERYLQAIGGREKLAAIENSKLESSAEVQGMSLNMFMTVDDKNRRFAQKMTMMGNVVQSLSYKEGAATVSGMGGSQALEGADLDDASMDFFVFPELHYRDLGYTLKLDGIHDVNGEDAYKVIVSTEMGSSRVNYYSVKSGLKLKNENEQNGDTLYKQYTEVDGVLVPMEMEISSPMIPFPLKNKVEKIEFNVSLEDSDF